MAPSKRDVETQVAESKRNLLTILTQHDVKNVNFEEIAAFLRSLAVDLQATRRHVEMQGVRGAPDWLAFEMDLWQISEDLRRYLRRHSEIRGRNPILEALASISRDKRFGKARQNMVLILGEFGRGEFAELFGDLLADPEVYGHAIKALLKSRIFDYEVRVNAVLKSTQHGWIRKAAKKYLEEAQKD